MAAPRACGTQRRRSARSHTIEVSSDVAAGSVKLAIDGQPEGERPRDGSPLSLDEITVGARYYNNGAGPQHVDGFGRADIAEVLVYNRVLTDDEIEAVRDYLTAKYAALKDALPPTPTAAPSRSCRSRIRRRCRCLCRASPSASCRSI